MKNGVRTSKRISVILAVSISLLSLIFLMACTAGNESDSSSDQNTKDVIAWDNKIGPSEVNLLYDKELGVVLYARLAGIVAIQISEPQTSLKNLPLSEKLNRSVTRTMDQKNNVAVYTYCGGRVWFSCDVAAVHIAEK